MTCKFDIPFDHTLEELSKYFLDLNIAFTTEQTTPRVCSLSENEKVCEIEIIPGKTLVCLDYDELGKLSPTFLEHLDSHRVEPARVLNTSYDPFIDVMPKIKKSKRRKTNYKFAFYYVFLNAVGMILYVFWMIYGDQG